MIFQVSKNDKMLFSVAWNTMFTDNWKVLVLNFPEMEIRPFLSQNVDGKMIFTAYWKVLVSNFSEMENTVFFEPKRWWKDEIYWSLKSSCFALFEDGKYGLSLSQKVDKKMTFTWSLWAFHGIPGNEKYGFSWSDENDILEHRKQENEWQKTV